MIELLVVVATIGILASVLMPALGRAKYGPTVTACKANYRQWGVACNLYAADNPQGAFPSFNVPASASRDVWNISFDMFPAMKPYGITVPMWFCPVRPQAFDIANATCQAETGHDIRDLMDLEIAMGYPGAPLGASQHDIWIPRYVGAGTSSLYPQVWNYVLGFPNLNANEAYQWPSRTIDIPVSKAPILSDRVVGTSTNLLQATEGHPVNGHVDSVNVLFGDGHVDLHKSSVMKWRWKGNFYTFY